MDHLWREGASAVRESRTNLERISRESRSASHHCSRPCRGPLFLYCVAFSLDLALPLPLFLRPPPALGTRRPLLRPSFHQLLLPPINDRCCTGVYLMKRRLMAEGEEKSMWKMRGRGRKYLGKLLSSSSPSFDGCHAEGNETD